MDVVCTDVELFGECSYVETDLGDRRLDERDLHQSIAAAAAESVESRDGRGGQQETAQGGHAVPDEQH